MPLCPTADAPSPIVTCPATPTWPASVTLSPTDRASGNPDLRGQQRVPSDVHAMPDLNEIIDFGACANSRLADGRAIDRRVRADLDVIFDHDDARLRNLLMGAVGPPHEAIAVAADDRAVLHHDAVADDARSRTATCE